jgi:hypothetical protein
MLVPYEVYLLASNSTQSAANLAFRGEVSSVGRASRKDIAQSLTGCRCRSAARWLHQWSKSRSPEKTSSLPDRAKIQPFFQPLRWRPQPYPTHSQLCFRSLQNEAGVLAITTLCHTYRIVGISLSAAELRFTHHEYGGQQVLLFCWKLVKHLLCAC